MDNAMQQTHLRNLTDAELIRYGESYSPILVAQELRTRKIDMGNYCEDLLVKLDELQEWKADKKANLRKWKDQCPI